MFAKVVYCFPAICSMISRPRPASLRRPDTVIDPSGKAILAATERRKGVSGVIRAASTDMTNCVPIGIPCGMLLRATGQLLSRSNYIYDYSD